VSHVKPVGVLAPLLASLLAATTARADTAGECIAAAEKSQPLKHDGRLRAAREQLRLCTRPQCPALIRSDCEKWLAEVDATMPSIVIHAADSSGADLADVRVLIDGEVVASRLDGRDIPVEPGAHVVRYEHAGSPPIEEQVVTIVGVQHRLLSVTFETPAGTASPTPTQSPPTRANRATPQDDSSQSMPELEPRHASPVLPLTLAGAGVLAAAVGGVLWGRGLSECRSNITPSATLCSPDQAGGAHTTLLWGDALVGAGVATAAVGLVLWLVRNGSDGPRPVVVGRDGSVVGLSGTF
jgi:hypothetical protein